MSTCGFTERSFHLALDNHLKLKTRDGDTREAIHPSVPGWPRPQTCPTLAGWGVVSSEKLDKVEEKLRVSVLEAARVG